MEKFKLTFYGGTGTVSGVNFLLEGVDKKFLIDAGLYKGCDDCENKNSKEFPYEPADIDFVFLTQSHIEHSGKLPKLVKYGFKGIIYSTPETKFIAEVVLKNYLENESISEKIFNENDLEKTLSLWETVKIDEEVNLGNDLVITFFDAHHIVGSAIINFYHNNRNLLFANSIGSSFAMSKSIDVDYLVIESVYGDKVHKIKSEREEYLENIIENTVNRQGSVLFPISSTDKIYTVLSEIKQLVDKGRIPKIPVFIDSSVAVKLMSAYENLFECGENRCDSVKDLVANFEGLKFIATKEDVAEMDEIKESKIIITEESDTEIGKKHIRDFVQHPNNTIVFVDYQLVGSLGRLLQEGFDNLKIDDKKINVLSQVETVDGYSSHADHNKLFMFVDDLKNTLKKVFIVIGEPKASMFLSQKIRDYMGVNTKCPKVGESCEIDL